eukprot:1152919-Pelagomonas_calceolata.AAC.7
MARAARVHPSCQPCDGAHLPSLARAADAVAAAAAGAAGRLAAAAPASAATAAQHGPWRQCHWGGGAAAAAAAAAAAGWLCQGNKPRASWVPRLQESRAAAGDAAAAAAAVDDVVGSQGHEQY